MDCNFQALPLSSVSVKLSSEPLRQPFTVWDPEVEEEAPVALWSEGVLGVVEDGWVDCCCDEVLGWVLLVPVWSELLEVCATAIPADSSRIEMPYTSFVIDATPRLSSALNFRSSRRPGEHSEASYTNV